MITTTYPNGQQLVSDALSQAAMNQFMQALTCGLLGLNPPDLSQVLVDWQTQGQPFAQTPLTNRCYLACVVTDEPYHRVRDRQYGQVGNQVQEIWTYTRPWKISWVFYGDNAKVPSLVGSSSLDRATTLWTGTFMDYFSDQLELEGLAAVNEPATPIRIPEQFNAQWWDRSDFSIELYELVTDTILDGAATSVEVKLYQGTGTNPVADFTVSET